MIFPGQGQCTEFFQCFDNVGWLRGRADICVHYAQRFFAWTGGENSKHRLTKAHSPGKQPLQDCANVIQLYQHENHPPTSRYYYVQCTLFTYLPYKVDHSSPPRPNQQLFYFRSGQKHLQPLIATGGRLKHTQKERQERIVLFQSMESNNLQ